MVYTNGYRECDLDDREATGYGVRRPPGGDGGPIAEGFGGIDSCLVVFGGEAVGAWRDLEKALELRGTQWQPHIYVCVDNTAAI